jgi:aspartate carbamoyltransferase regulatory subunit
MDIYILNISLKKLKYNFEMIKIKNSSEPENQIDALKLITPPITTKLVKKYWMIYQSTTMAMVSVNAITITFLPELSTS